MPKNDLTKYVGYYYKAHNENGNIDRVTASLEFADVNLFGVKPVTIFSFYEEDFDSYYSRRSNLKKPESGPSRVSGGSYDWFTCDRIKLYPY